MNAAAPTLGSETLMFCWQADDDGIAFLEVGGKMAAEVIEHGHTQTAFEQMLGRHAVITVDDDFTPRIKAWLPLPDEWAISGGLVG